MSKLNPIKKPIKEKMMKPNDFALKSKKMEANSFFPKMEEKENAMRLSNTF